ncbi:MAG: tRNA (guanine-N7)-methyltransferase [Acidobacteria bacterium]|nr:MAG: tRNA (guanine-N7)-methyltransferase [Acidobacteriota bacterium]
MRLTPLYAAGGVERSLYRLPAPLDLDRLLPGDGPWQVEIGFGKGRFLLERALACPEQRFLGIEVASKYFRLLARRAARRGGRNLVALRGEALYLLSTFLPRGFASAVHVYFPDPWPKSRHHKRRLFDPETVDLVLGLLRPGGELDFATDFLAYGERVAELLAAVPGLEVERLPGPWPDGARTNYEAKYMAAGRPILRLAARLREPLPELWLHPDGRAGVLAAVAPPRSGDEPAG